ncbi:MAG: UDP-N-acetylglucosamine 2-epimerase (hydrolyzing) [Lachnospiraceae bacterium]|nr:UDP-N-acetylglucosamine 2-epimerase (hydrolyzing) [Lachnospiraceae bacterium]
MERRKISFATGSRADYGIVRNYLKLLNEDSDIDLSILVTGALLSNEYGHQVELIYRDGFKIGAEIEIKIDPSSNAGVIHSMADALDKFGEYFMENRSDLLIILGDRYEMLSVATAAAMNRIPILHLHGGEATFGNYDEFIRHSITKMSLFHITATEEYRRRVIQLGEEPERVFNLGALGAENCLRIDEGMVPDRVMGLKGTRYFVVLFHPETLTSASTMEQIMELLSAVDRYNNYKFVFLGANADTHADVIRNKVKGYVDSHDNCEYFENLPTSGYHFLVRNSLGLIGNSSSGLIEVPSLKAYTINIGHRQDGRVRGNSVMDVPCRSDAICEAIDKVINKGNKDEIENPYFRCDSDRNYYLTTKMMLKMIEQGVGTNPKTFFDFKDKEFANFLCGF